MAASRAPSLHARSRAAPACLGQGLWSLLRSRGASKEREGFACGCKAGVCQSPAVELPAPLHLCTKGWQPVTPAAVSVWDQRLRSVMGRGRSIKLQKKLKSWSQRSHLSGKTEPTPQKFQLDSQEESQHPSDSHNRVTASLRLCPEMFSQCFQPKADTAGGQDPES